MCMYIKRKALIWCGERRATLPVQRMNWKCTEMNWKFRTVKILSAGSRAVIFLWVKWLLQCQSQKQHLIAAWTYSTVGISEQELSRFPFYESVWGEVSQNHIFKGASFNLFLEYTIPVAGFNSLCNRPRWLWGTVGEVAKKRVMEYAEWPTGWWSALVFLGGWDAVVATWVEFQCFQSNTKHSFLRGDQASFKAELDRVLSAQVLFAVWNQQSEVGCGHRVPLQLPRQVLLSRLLWKGDFCSDLIGNCYWGIAGDHGGTWVKANNPWGPVTLLVLPAGEWCRDALPSMW